MIEILNTLIIFPALLTGLLFSQDSQSNIIAKPPIIEAKGIYITGYTAGWKNRREELVDLVRTTELNAMVIDIKDVSGRILFDTDVPLAKEIGSTDIRIPDLREWIKELKEEGIYTIARIAVFQDPFLATAKPEIALVDKNGAIWRDYKGQSWVDPTRKEIWKYNLDLAKEAVGIGFDEINFDYIRFPSDGKIDNIVYANLDKSIEKYEVMADFYEYIDKSLRYYPVLTSADLFGMVLLRKDGLGIGQRYEDAAPHFDFIAPMVYPSHYPAGFEGYSNPADHPYDIIYKSLIRVEHDYDQEFRAKLRPWLQDFDLGAIYTPEMIRLQKHAVYDANGFGWLLWNASNRYTAGGLEKE